MIDVGGRGLGWRAVRWLPLALIPVVLAASTFPGEYRVPPVYWLLAVAAGVVFAIGDRWPLAMSLSLSGLAAGMFVIPAWGPSELVPYLGALGLVEAVARGGRRASVAVSAAWALAWVGGHWGGHAPTFWRGATFVAAAAYVGLPLLAGLYLRGQRQLTASLAARAAEAGLRARAEERAAMARELHDLVAHHMASIVLRVKVARRVLADPDPRVGEVLDDVGGTASGALTDIRRLLAGLRDPGLGAAPLLDAEMVRAEIAAAVERVRRGGLRVDAEIATRLEGLDAIARLTLLRLVQESLTNVMKHADRGRPVWIAVARTESGVAVRVGNAVAAAAGPPGHGLIGMGERAVLAGGSSARRCAR
ncbi:sensor histidine kinase [Nocardia seriolae]|uniref:sensor histidine kinase n=1 Tax=Nocardia seriolae TaxID=37332 RepID=UPI002E316384|nr:histidine kinase [Nocardia seriolae]